MDSNQLPKDPLPHGFQQITGWFVFPSPVLSCPRIKEKDSGFINMIGLHLKGLFILFSRHVCVPGASVMPALSAGPAAADTPPFLFPWFSGKNHGWVATIPPWGILQATKKDWTMSLACLYHWRAVLPLNIEIFYKFLMFVFTTMTMQNVAICWCSLLSDSVLLCDKRRIPDLITTMKYT